MGSSARNTATAHTAYEYTEWCIKHGRRAFPPTYLSVAGYIAAKVAGLKGSSKSVGNWLSSLRCFCKYARQPWLSMRDEYRVGTVRAQLTLSDTEPKKQSAPFTLDLFDRLLRDHIDLVDGSVDHLILTMAATGHDGLLRGGEILCGIKAKRVKWDDRDRSFTVWVGPTKTVRLGYGVAVRIADHSGPSAYKLLRRWFDTHDLWHKPLHYIFPKCHRAAKGSPIKFDFHRPAGAKWFSRAVKRLVAILGLDPNLYTGHSLRAGGATDLFILQVPFAKIKKYGRWVSDCALIYYRDDVEVAGTVARAFGRMGRCNRRNRGA